MKAIWKGSIAFGLVNIPINVYPASEEHALEFHMLHKKDLSPIRFARICKEEDKEVPYKDIVRGFEYEKGEYIVIEDQDFKEADAKKTSSIEIQYFTDKKQIDPIYYEKPYFLEPDKKSGKAYKLLTEALQKSEKVAIANFVFRNREHIGVILPHKEGLLLIQMRYHVEIRPFEKLEIPQAKIAVAELKMALTFIDQLTKSFEPEKHHDTYVESLMQVIEQKLQGKKPVHKAKKAQPSYEARDLMHLLKQSLQKSLSKTETTTKKKQAAAGKGSSSKRKRTKKSS